MSIPGKIMVSVLATFLLKSIAYAQVPVEVFGGNRKATVDIMFFRFLKNSEGRNSKFLFFNRNRAAMDYTMTTGTGLPQFGFTEAFSYNHEKLKGFAPVAVVQILNKGIYPKAGIQFAKTKRDYTLFTWAVAETLRDPNIDLFILARYTPRLSGKLHLFSQIESVNAFPTLAQKKYSFTQRFRLGLKIKEFQLGAGLDLSQSGSGNFSYDENFGGFLRYEF